MLTTGRTSQTIHTAAHRPQIPTTLLRRMIRIRHSCRPTTNRQTIPTHQMPRVPRCKLTGALDFRRDGPTSGAEGHEHRRFLPTCAPLCQWSAQRRTHNYGSVPRNIPHSSDFVVHVTPLFLKFLGSNGDPVETCWRLLLKAVAPFKRYLPYTGSHHARCRLSWIAG